MSPSTGLWGRPAAPSPPPPAWSRPPRAGHLCAIVAATCIAGAAAAHTILVPRVLHLRVAQDRLELAVGQQLHTGPLARELRERFDTDRSGMIDESERARLVAFVHDDARALVRLWLDGRALAAQAEAESLRDERAGSVAEGDGWMMRGESVIALCPRPGPHVLRVADAPDGGRVEPVRVDLPPGYTFTGTAACVGAAPFAPGGEGQWIGGLAAGPGWTEIRFTVAGSERPPDPRTTGMPTRGP